MLRKIFDKLKYCESPVQSSDYNMPFGEATIGTFKMSDFRHHEVTDGTLTSIVYPVNINMFYLVRYQICDFWNYSNYWL